MKVGDHDSFIGVIKFTTMFLPYGYFWHFEYKRWEAYNKKNNMKKNLTMPSDGWGSATKRICLSTCQNDALPYTNTSFSFILFVFIRQTFYGFAICPINVGLCLSPFCVLRRKYSRGHKAHQLLLKPLTFCQITLLRFASVIQPKLYRTQLFCSFDTVCTMYFMCNEINEKNRNHEDRPNKDLSNKKSTQNEKNHIELWYEAKNST